MLDFDRPSFAVRVPLGEAKPRTSWLLGVGASLSLACLEPNPYAMDSGNETGSSATTSNGDGDGDGDGGPLCDPCDLGFETINFDAGPDGFQGQVPKPPQSHTVPFALVREYVPGNSDNLGYEMTWSDAGAAWELTVTLTGAANNSRVRGVAVVLGSNTEPSVETRTVDGDEGCDGATIDPLDGRTHIDVIELYAPGDDAVFSFARELDATGNSVTVDYCVTQSDTTAVSLGFKLVAFELPEGVTGIGFGELTLDSEAPQSTDYAQIASNAEVVHLIDVHEFDEAASSDLGYSVDCSQAAPFACNFDLRNFNEGARVTVGGAIVAIQ